MASNADWRKGIVYTTRRSPSGSYRITASFKTKSGPGSFAALYQRATRLAQAAIARLGPPAEPPAIVCHGWRSFGEQFPVAVAFVTLAIGEAIEGKSSPSPEDLLEPGGATLEELARLAPQRVEEIYSEGDFSDPASPLDPIFVSYGEYWRDSAPVDFTPIIERAEQFAAFYARLLEEFGDVPPQSLSIARREWFRVTGSDLVTIQIYLSP